MAFPITEIQLQKHFSIKKYQKKPKTGKTHPRIHFWPLQGGFSTIATYKKCIFSKSPNSLILKFWLMIPTTHTFLKSLNPAMVDLKI